MNPSCFPARRIDGYDRPPGDRTVPPKYRLRCRVGAGATSVVYLACDLRLQRLVALKFLDETRPSIVERFRREARVTARLNNPSIVKIYEMDEFQGRLYIAMEYIEGGNLASAELSGRDLVITLRQVACALEHAHQHGVVHRDIKPENILLDRRGRAFLTDFGLARDFQEPAEMHLSTDGQVLGTPASMAPEQARGDRDAVDARSDVYSLGATLFHQLAGRWPFVGPHVVDVLHAVIHDSPPALGTVTGPVSGALEAIVEKCLRKDPDDRYGSMKELMQAFDHYLKNPLDRSQSRGAP